MVRLLLLPTPSEWSRVALGAFLNSEKPQAAFKCAAHRWRLAAAGEEFISGTVTRLEKKQPHGFILPIWPDTTGWGGSGGGASPQGKGDGWTYVWGGWGGERERERLGLRKQSIQSIIIINQSAGCGPVINVLILFSFYFLVEYLGNSNIIWMKW